MPIGTCVDLGPTGSGGEIVINCGYAHDAELDDIQEPPSNVYPGATALSNEVNSWCKNNLQILSFMAETYKGNLGYTVPTSYFTIYPSLADWALGHTKEYCFFTGAPGQQLNGSFVAN
jgi:hypothetical protein